MSVRPPKELIRNQYLYRLSNIRILKFFNRLMNSFVRLLSVVLKRKILPFITVLITLGEHPSDSKLARVRLADKRVLQIEEPHDRYID